MQQGQLRSGNMTYDQYVQSLRATPSALGNKVQLNWLHPDRPLTHASIGYRNHGFDKPESARFAAASLKKLTDFIGWLPAHADTKFTFKRVQTNDPDPIDDGDVVIDGEPFPSADSVRPRGPQPRPQARFRRGTRAGTAQGQRRSRQRRLSTRRSSREHVSEKFSTMTIVSASWPLSRTSNRSSHTGPTSSTRRQ